LGQEDVPEAFRSRSVLAAGAVFLAVLVAIVPALCSCSQTREDLIKRGTEFAGKGDYEGAIEQFRLALEKGKPDHRLIEAIADAHARMGNLDKAIDTYLEAADVLKKDALAISEQARAAQNHAERERLLYLLEERINPYSSQVYMRLGMLYMAKEDHATAVVAFKLALERDERNLRARLELASLMERKGDTEAALNELRQFLKNAEKASKDEKILYGIGKAEIESARRDYEKLLLKRSGEPGAEEQGG
jgi:tetratricopeptide (TPR) repeat protein